MAEVVKVCTGNFGKGAQDIEVYKKLGGYANISEKLFNMSQFEVIDYVQRSGLRGRGGGHDARSQHVVAVGRQCADSSRSRRHGLGCLCPCTLSPQGRQCEERETQGAPLS